MTGLENANQQADGLGGLSTSAIKQCCAAVYDSDVARLLLGASLHPGGAKPTEHLGQILVLGPQMRVLDVSAGWGASAIRLAKRFGCEVVGIDYSQRGVETAKRQARDRGLRGKGERKR